MADPTDAHRPAWNVPSIPGLVRRLGNLTPRQHGFVLTWLAISEDPAIRAGLERAVSEAEQCKPEGAAP